MVEMRWLHQTDGAAHYQKLQYRYYRTYEVFDSGTFDANLARWACGWSEWMDIPHVNEAGEVVMK